MTELGVVSGGLRGEARTRDLERWERTVARRSAEIRAIVPDVESTAVVDIGAAEMRAATAGASLDGLLLHAVARALRAAPALNGAYRDGAHTTYTRVNLGVVIAPPGRFAVATLFDADERSASALAADLAELRRRGLAGELTGAEQAGATFTVAFPPGASVVRHSPLILPGQAAALAVGAVRDAPVVREGALAAGRVLELTLAGDARVVLPAQAAAFLEALVAALEAER